MKFGVFIRSIGERTEKLSYASVAHYIPKKDIHLIKNYMPSYNAYFKMFELAKEKKYDWYLGLDADVILKKEWWKMFNQIVAGNKLEKYFRVHFYVKDYISNQNLVRGNNFYNGKYTDLCNKFLRQNIRIGKYWFYYKRKGLSRGYFLKPETSIRTHMKGRLNISDKIYKELIGWHGYEQFFSEIFRQYILRRRRSPDFKESQKIDFLKDKNCNKLLKRNDYDRFVASLAWNNVDIWKIKNVDGVIQKKINLFFKKQGIKEKKVLNMTLDEFIRKYGN